MIFHIKNGQNLRIYKKIGDFMVILKIFDITVPFEEKGWKGCNEYENPAPGNTFLNKLL